MDALNKGSISAIRQATSVILSGGLEQGKMQLQKKGSSGGTSPWVSTCDLEVAVEGNHEEKFAAVLTTCEQSDVWKSFGQFLRAGDVITLVVRKDYASNDSVKERGVNVDVIDIRVDRPTKSGKVKSTTMRLFVAASVDGELRMVT